MIISHRKKFIFIHIYKVAGLSIRAALQRYDDRSASDFPFYENIKFALGKRFKSLSTWAIDHIKAKEIKRHLDPLIYDSYFKFTFVRNPWDWQVSLYHFMLQSPNHPQHRLISRMKSFDEYIDWRINRDMELQFEFVYDTEGNKIVDFVGRFESLQNDFDEACRRLNIETATLPVINKSRHLPYREYYNERTRQMVAEAFKKDIETFHYEF